jgi:hypothetical protein
MHSAFDSSGSARALFLVEGSGDVVPTRPSHAAEIPLEEHRRGKHHRNTKKPKEDRRRVEGDQLNGSENEYDSGPLALAAGMAIDGLVPDPLGKGGILFGERLLKLSEDALFVF